MGSSSIPEDLVDESAHHGVLTGADQVQVLALDLVHHGVHVTAQNTLSLISNGQVLVGATDSITMKKGEGTFITMDKEGDITLKGSKIYSN